MNDLAKTQNQTQQVVVKRIGDKNTLSGLLSNADFVKSLRDVLPKHLTPERITKMALLAASRQPKLFECTQSSFLQSIMRSAELGLDCTGTLGQGYLVPYYNGRIRAMECQFIPGYQGLINLARRSGNIESIESRPVYAGDLFEIDFGNQQPIKHKPNWQNRGELVMVYAQAWMKDSARPVVEYMTADEISAIKDRSKSRDRDGNITGPWTTDFVEMARKTVIRRLAKYLPLSPEFADAVDADNQQYETANTITADIAKHAGVQGLKETLKRQDALPQPQEETPQESADPAQDEIPQEQPDESPAEPAQDAPAFRCVNGHHFDVPKKTGKKLLCPQCLTDDIVDASLTD
jgi:recombination protein RecT